MQQKTFDRQELGSDICVVVGIRPNIVKQSPLIRTLHRRKLPHFVIHSGQHYSYDMDKTFFEDLELPEPEYRLNDVRNHTTHGAQTGAMIAGIEAILMERRPALVLVGGDANTDLCGAMAARKLHIPVGHVEAGLRSYDWRMPEEHNRIMIDHISELLFSPTANASGILRYEHVRGEIVEVGSTTVDAVQQHATIAQARSEVMERLELTERSYAVLTVHREENADSPDNLRAILDGVERFARATGIEIIFPAHPRTRERMARFGLQTGPGITVVAPVGYLDCLRLLSSATALMTDSGGAQQEACILKVPCVTLRQSTEWIETVAIGANVVVGTDPDAIEQAGEAALTNSRSWTNPYGDGTSGEQVIDASLRAMADGFPLAPPPEHEPLALS